MSEVRPWSQKVSISNLGISAQPRSQQTWLPLLSGSVNPLLQGRLVDPGPFSLLSSRKRIAKSCSRIYKNYFVPYYSPLPGLSPTCPHLGISLTPSRAGYSLSICSPLPVWAADGEQMVLIGCTVTDKKELGLSLQPLSWQLLHKTYRFYFPICLFGCTDTKEHFSWKSNCGTSSSSNWNTLHTNSCEDPLAYHRSTGWQPKYVT